MIGIYCRISGKKVEDRDVSIEDQEAQGVAFAKKNNLKYRTYKDVGVSGAKNEIEDRPAFAEMFDDIKNKKINSVYVIDQSRLERNSRIWHLFVYMMQENNCIYYSNGELVDLDNPETKVLTGILSLTNELFAKLTSRKTKSANLRNALKGKGHGITAFGYKKDDKGFLIIDKEQAEIIREIYKLSLDGVGTYTIANILNNKGVPPKSHQFKSKYIEIEDKYTGRKTKYSRDKVRWRGNVIYDMLRNPIYKGERHFADVVANIEGIISEGLWEQVNNNLSKNKKRVGPNNKYKYLLNGILFCENCGSEFKGKYRKSGKHKTYNCKGISRGLSCSENRGINIIRLESFVIHHLFHSKELSKKLSGLKVDGTALEYAKNTLIILEEKEKEIIKSHNHIRKLLLDPDLQNDDTIKDSYLKGKGELESTQLKMVEVREEISKLSMSNRKNKLDKIFNGFDYKMNFDQIKESIHSIVESIKIKYLSKEKAFLISIYYDGFDEFSEFFTDHQLMNWSNLISYKISPKTIEDKQDELDLIRYLDRRNSFTKEQLISALKKTNNWQKTFVKYNYDQLLDIVNSISMTENQFVLNKVITSDIRLKKDNLYDFNSLPS